MTQSNFSKKTVLLGMSGGVDSSVCALLLKERGFTVIGVSLVMISDFSIYSFSFATSVKKSVLDAKAICESLNIEHKIVDVSFDFKNQITDKFVLDYANCLTPSPCVLCNKVLKFASLFREADKLGCDFVATGHYAKLVKDGDKVSLYRANSQKDQSYMLYRLSNDELKRCIFPLGDYNAKDEVRKIAHDNDFSVAAKKDSLDLCFVENDYVSYLKENGIKEQKGRFLLSDGTFLGYHNGAYKYTIGQRKGLGISFSEPLYVIDKCDNDVIVGTKDELYTSEVYLTDFNWLDKSKINDTLYAQTRYRGELVAGTLQDNHFVTFDKIKKVAPGQSVVFYDNDKVLGGAIATKKEVS